MSDRYTDTYRAVVVDTQDPLGERRLALQIPDILGDVSAWARPSQPPADITTLPAIGDLVWVVFEAGDPQYPVWQVEPSHVAPPATPAGYGGVYRGEVIDNADPLMANRLLVLVPEVTAEAAWALPDSGVSGTEPPAVGTTVWIQYESGDPNYPRWVGVA